MYIYTEYSVEAKDDIYQVSTPSSYCIGTGINYQFMFHHVHYRTRILSNELS
jgi:hypothetical protein